MKKALSALIALALLSPLPSLAQNWVGTWAAAPLNWSSVVTPNLSIGSEALTVRQVVHVSLGGRKVRLALSNEFGHSPLLISDVHFQEHDSKDSIIPESDHKVTFSGKAAITIPEGEFVTSDPVDFALENSSDVDISFFVPKRPVTSMTMHPLSRETTYISSGNEVTSISLTSPTTIQHWYFLKNVQVEAPKESFAIVAVGDSITDGFASTADKNRRWTDDLATRLLASPETRHIAVLNEGISGNRLLKPDTGPALLDRLHRDTLSAPGVKYIVLLIGINDIGRTAKPHNPNDPVTIAELLEGYSQVIHRAHADGIKVIGATLTPYTHANYASHEGERMRQALNTFIRQPDNFDGVIDFDKVVRDPNHLDEILPAYNDGDHLHPNDAGYQAMADAVDLSLFR
ncbi:Lysophospholipase L1 [Granulicella rosea]|uniref:Lysophospholipase L1 n=1 Tax=Granulicella rosea TaxID=474952 RepID=A0A239ECB8_9BACT|nr:SGNH/GDSL hydrolase family protein [Granulicella rosea]SNS41542.1 Lysophospholipase L1 [Granulicella rosea]